jgi:hypothetical protein
MKTLRTVLGILAIIPLALLGDNILFRPTYFDEDSLRVLVYMFFGVPILILNFWVWGAPETIEFYFFGKNYEDS